MTRLEKIQEKVDKLCYAENSHHVLQIQTSIEELNALTDAEFDRIYNQNTKLNSQEASRHVK